MGFYRRGPAVGGLRFGGGHHGREPNFYGDHRCIDSAATVGHAGVSGQRGHDGHRHPVSDRCRNVNRR
jgi:hypothetical protein